MQVPEITFEQTFLIPVSGRNAGAAEFPIYLILAYGEKEMGILFHVTSTPLAVMDLPRIMEKFHAHGELEYDIISCTYRTSVRVGAKMETSRRKEN